MVAVYTCPDRFGNFGHDLATAVLMAIMTNRTLLWRFVPRDGNTWEDCRDIFQISNWVASYDEILPYYDKYLPTEPMEIRTKWYQAHYQPAPAGSSSTTPNRYVPTGIL